MRLLTVFSLVTLAAADIAAQPQPQFYPLTRSGKVPEIQPYTLGQEVMIDCILRNIDNGEHNFDTNNRIVYKAFPVCKETGKPLTFRYGVSEDVNCTITFTDELYHLFQLYVHEDAPFSCRIPVSTEMNSLEKGGAYIPLTFNFRGEVHELHMDVDPYMNMIITKPASSDPGQQTVVNAIAWSAGTNATRLTIGNTFTLELAVRWFDYIKPKGSRGTAALPYPDGFYKLPMATMPVSYLQYALSLIGVAILSALASGFISYRLKKVRGYSVLDTESSISKRD